MTNPSEIIYVIINGIGNVDYQVSAFLSPCEKQGDNNFMTAYCLSDKPGEESIAEVHSLEELSEYILEDVRRKETEHSLNRLDFTIHNINYDYIDCSFSAHYLMRPLNPEEFETLYKLLHSKKNKE